jgi:hypothetical protein
MARLVCLLVTASLIEVAGRTIAMAQIESDKPSEADVFAIPKRRAPDAPPRALPGLPSGAGRVTSATLHLVIRRDTERRPSFTRRQIVSRTLDRIHIAGYDGREWLFERNSIDPRRVSATLLEHASRAIVLYEESDLRTSLGIRGWADVLALGFDTQLLSRYERTQVVRTIGSIRFARYVLADERAKGEDVWWSEEQVLPGRFAIADGTGVTRFTVEHAHAGVDAALLRPAIVRFPDYRVVDLADWQEKH